MSKIPIYPDIKIDSTRFEGFRDDEKVLFRIKMSTNLRVQGSDGKWYLQLFIGRFSVNEEKLDHKYMSGLSEAFNRDIYYAQILGVVDANTVFADGRKLFTLDENQESEIERLTKLLDFGTRLKTSPNS